MSLTEKTLELNVTHELLVLGQGIATVLWAGASYTQVVSPRPGPPIYAAGLTLREEAKAGWDVSIELPAVGSRRHGSGRSHRPHPGALYLHMKRPMKVREWRSTSFDHSIRLEEAKNTGLTRPILHKSVNVGASSDDVVGERVAFYD